GRRVLVVLDGGAARRRCSAGPGTAARATPRLLPVRALRVGVGRVGRGVVLPVRGVLVVVGLLVVGATAVAPSSAAAAATTTRGVARVSRRLVVLVRVLLDGVPVVGVLLDDAHRVGGHVCGSRGGL